MIHSAAVKLTLWYLAMIMALSLSFSLVLYHVSSQELDRGLRRQGVVLNQYFPTLDAFQQFRITQLDDERHSLVFNLVLLNVICLVLGGGVSFLLAQRHLRPIEEALESQTRFTADASHELRTPLTAMQTEIEVALRDGKLTREEAIGLLKSNLEEVEKLRGLSDGLLRLARRNGQPPALGPVPLAEAVGEAVARQAATAKQRHIAMSVESVERLVVKGDHQSLIDLVAILLDNAIKYGPVNSSISITALRQGHEAVLAVADQGEGIAASDLPHIFERFYRADRSRSKEKSDGYGLGLSIAQQIVQMHGGEISAASQPGKGSIFTVKLPLADAAHNQKEPPR